MMAEVSTVVGEKAAEGESDDTRIVDLKAEDKESLIGPMVVAVEAGEIMTLANLMNVMEIIGSAMEVKLTVVVRVILEDIQRLLNSLPAFLLPPLPRPPP